MITTRLGRRTVRWTSIGAAAVLLLAGLFALGRVTAGNTGRHGSYAQGLQVGEAHGRQEGRAEQEVSGVPSPAAKSTATAFNDGYVAGENDVFTGYDGGWAVSAPYVIALAVGDGPVVYRIASRTPLEPSVDYYLCPGGHSLCQQARH
jgi:hypothetical protein